MLDVIALILTVIGGINWGLIGIFQFDLVAWLFGGQGAVLSRIIYTLVGIAAVWCISLLFRDNDLIEKQMHRKKPRHFVLKRLGFYCYIRRLKVLSEIRTCAEQAGVIAKCGGLHLKVFCELLHRAVQDLFAKRADKMFVFP